MATNTLSAFTMRVIIQRMQQADAELRQVRGCSRTCLTMPLEWLMEAAISPVVVETVDTLETSA